jgi:hypothetical protein
VNRGYRSGLKIVLGVLCLALLLSGCGAFNRSALAATWKSPASGMSMQFMETGQLRVILPETAGAPPLLGSYQFMNDDTVVLMPSQLVNALLTDPNQNLNLTDRNPVGYSIQNDTLTLSVNGTEFNLQRVK